MTEADLEAIPAAAMGGVAGRVCQPHCKSSIICVRYMAVGGARLFTVRNAEERAWLREAAESGRFSVEQKPFDALEILRRLTKVETFEHFLQRSFVAKTRFSIEGLDVMVPLLDEVIGEGQKQAFITYCWGWRTAEG